MCSIFDVIYNETGKRDEPSVGSHTKGMSRREFISPGIKR